jgi:uncharacterized protein YkwD
MKLSKQTGESTMKKVNTFTKLIVIMSLIVAILPTTMFTKLISVESAEQSTITLQDKFIIKDSRALVPMRSIFETLGASVVWDSKTNSVRAVQGRTSIVLHIGNKSAVLNDRSITLDVSPIIIEGRTMVPTRFVVESLGAYISWDSSNRVVTVVKEGQTIRITESGRSEVQPKNEFDEKEVLGTEVQEKEVQEKEFMVNQIGIGSSKSEVLNTFGDPKRITLSKYGFEWYAFHHDYKNFVLVGLDSNDKVVGLYTNDPDWSSKSGLKVGWTQGQALEILGDPLTDILKQNTRYSLNYADEKELSIFSQNDSYVTLFFDIHENNALTSVLIIDKNVEESFLSYYGEPSEALKEGLELQNYDLTNSIRVRMGLEPLSWDEKIRDTARKHSLDMATNQYFSHQNLLGKSPFDRMSDDGIQFSTASENIAYGQMDSIYVHEAWMNSLGHRKNILGDYNRVGVGVAFNSTGVPYYTQNFYTPR